MRTFTKAAAFVAMLAIPGAAFAAQAPAAPKKATREVGGQPAKKRAKRLPQSRTRPRRAP